MILPVLSKALLMLVWALTTDSISTQTTISSPRWPDRQLNVLLDHRSLNKTERQILEAFFDQLEHKTCLRINRISSELVNPFDPRGLDKSENNFLFLFKSPTGATKETSIGLSSFGCVDKGRQSVVLTNAAFSHPKLVLKYHLLRSLGVKGLEKPDKELRLRQQGPSLSQKINTDSRDVISASNNEELMPTYYAYATLANQLDGAKVQPVEYLEEAELDVINKLYDCQKYRNRLSPKPLRPAGEDKLGDTGDNRPKKTGKIEGAEEESRNSDHVISNQLTDEQSISENESKMIDLVLEEANKEQEDRSRDQQSLQPACMPMQSCILNKPSNHLEPIEGGDSSRPMILKLDAFHAKDPNISQANQMKLSLLNDSSPDGLGASYRYMSAPPSLTNAANGLGSADHLIGAEQPKSEMLISFEHTNENAANPIAALASSHVLKLCSCTCQTMVPTSSTPATPTTITTNPVTAPSRDTTLGPSLPPQTSTNSTQADEQDDDDQDEQDVTTKPTPPRPTTREEPEPTIITTSPAPPVTTPPAKPTEMPTEPPSTMPPPPPTVTMLPEPPPPAPTTPPTSPKPNNNNWASNACTDVEWARPNKTLYSSSKIVWDVDRGNQNYFICNNLLNGEIVPGKTHGFSCKLSSEGKAMELHNFSVLTKPESVSLAWVHKSSQSLGTTFSPVVGGFSKQQDPYIVSRCLVRDENNDVTTLIGYVSSSGVAWFPFDDIQIECSQYDVLACVN